MFRHERLLAWKRAYQLAIQVHRATSAWPKAELYGLTSQARRAATSIPSNIAEGSARRGPREFRRFLDVSLGSHAELHTLLTMASDLGYTEPSVQAELIESLDVAGRLLWGLYRRVAAG